jgi:hypothetical protein
MTDIDLIKLALGALEYHASQTRPIYQTDKTITALKERLADPMREVQRLGQEIEQEPIAKYSDIVSDGGLDPRNKFDVSPQRKPLTDEEAFKLVEQDNRMEEYVEAAVRLIRRTEAAHGIKEST